MTAQLPLAAGVGFSQRYQKKGGVVVVLFGDAAVNIGAFHESLDMAAVWKLPEGRPRPPPRRLGPPPG